ncbi:MAG: fumarylacetoacetate hydrolase family protein [Deltaproteobacteria bacterium]|nr:fumarylacetoacetate hydrolase family protein [Deltaproteobacteria bacterium]
MKVARYEFKGRPWYGLVDEANGTLRELVGEPFENVRETGAVRRFEEIFLLAPVAPGKIVAVGLNYKDHAKEVGMRIPEEPLLFLKAPSAVLPPGGNIVYPRQSKHVDFEAELAVVIGRTAKDVSSDDASAYIFGYTCINDVTARDLQIRDIQFARSKGFDTFAPLGPWISTGVDPDALGVRCLVNGQVKQAGNTRDMGSSVGRLVEYISSNMTLYPGDVIATGTPAGVGPLNPGDTVTVEIDGIGTLTNRVVGQEPSR